MKAHGIDVDVAPLLEDDYLEKLYAGRRKDLREILCAYIRRLGLLIKSNSFDLLWVEKEILPWFPAWAEAILDHLGIPYIVDYDDAIFHRYDMHPKAIIRSLLGTKINTVMSRAALVIVGNKYLADRARKAGARRVEYLPTVIDLDRYRTETHSKSLDYKIGWIGSPTTAKYLYPMHPTFVEVCRDSGTRLVLVGSGQVDLVDVPTETRPWSEYTEVADIQSFDVGIAPMTDEPWSRGKCGYKLIQYMACARPVVASPVGVAPKIIENGISGFLATTTKEWVNAICVLRRNYKLAERMGKAGRIKVERQYCMQVTAPLLVSLMREAANEFN